MGAEALPLYAAKYGTDKYDHGYMPMYSYHLYNPQTILEIGIFAGASLRMWKAAFPKARVIGVDIDPTRSYPDLECIIGDCKDPRTYNDLPPRFDLVVDDGSHQAMDIIYTFFILWPKVTLNGWYVIEDLSTAFDPEFGGDQWGGPVFRALNGLVMDAGNGRIEMHIYNEIVFIKKLFDGV